MANIDIMKPAIDMEAKVDQGYLGIGVFAPADMIDEAQADEIMDQMKGLMTSIA